MCHANERDNFHKIKTLQIDLNLSLLTYRLATPKVKILGCGSKLPLTRLTPGKP
jgi:hypothetical protein